VKRDRVHIDHILECIEWIARYTADGRDTFFSDRKTQSAVLRELQTLAESTQRLSAELKDTHPKVPWEGIAGFRNVLVHDYLGINLERVWDIVERDLPVLGAAAETMRQTLQEDET
jgi:uncharacterized protein with HEPN domain